MKSILSCSGLIVLSVLIWGTGNSQAETLQDAVHYMLQTNPEIRAISFNRLARDEEVKQAQAGYWPTLDVFASAGVSEEDNYLNDETQNLCTKDSLEFMKAWQEGFADGVIGVKSNMVKKKVC